MGMKLLFICTGNTCRSPMAEALARKILGDSVQVSSAGLAAYPGESASSYAIEVLSEKNIDLSGHRSRRMEEQLLAEADWIIPMTEAQVETLSFLYPLYIHKIRCLGDWGEQKKDVPDPWSGSLAVYRQTAQEIEELLNVLKEYLR